ncbi:hypothetical protein WJX72_005291 [[Myrmecia] bisecta]|uniref:Ankyrin n=1 Tax=[Myrmecia] bisecta TaxID=41462 RepID=A0AAW1P4H1_9CHLO
MSKAAQKGDVNKLERLLDKRPDLISSDGLEGQTGYTPLHYASREGRLAAVNLLLQRGADPNKATQAGSATSLHRAAFMGHLQVVELLLKHGACGILQDADGETALHKAAAQGHLKVAELLAARFPDALQMRDRKGHTPAEAATGDVTGKLI